MKHFTIKPILLFLFVSLMVSRVFSQSSEVSIDEEGIMRWPDGKEVHGFGVNYTVPFAHAYRTALKLGVDPREAMEKDVYHFARLGFDAYRVHLWDTEISDEEGNLLENEHLELFDYLIHLMKEREMKFLLTPIAFWGNGWPEPDEKTPGFSHKYGKEACLTNPEAIEAQANYLHQFLNHVNFYTGLAYKDDPDVVAFEISNEPHHAESSDKVTAYIRKMVDSMKRTGCQKPIFYNVSHSIHLVDAYYAAGIDGGTFQWYPTGLLSGEEIGGNLLPNVERYAIPFSDHEGFRQAAKVVYEFDAADVGRSYIYPAMARSFRTAGIQWATHFAYDPTYMAYANTEYDTHYMNLVYAPQKALSLKIAGEVFHQVPVYKDYGNYPDNRQFDDFKVSYKDDLAELVGAEKFFYTNNTRSVPPDLGQLKQLAGFGNSPVVQYDGRGAYFLDQLDEGVWRLEVMPDAYWIDNLFGSNSLNKKIADIQWNQRKMSINLPDLGTEFNVKGLNEGNRAQLESREGEFPINPGTYLLCKKGVQGNRTPESPYKNIKIGEYHAPASTVKGTNLLHEPIEEWTEGEDFQVTATVVSEERVTGVTLFTYNEYKPVQFSMEDSGKDQYSIEVPGELLKRGFFRYYVVVRTNEKELTFPSGRKTNPKDWDFYADNPFEVRVLTDSNAVYLFDARRDFELLNMSWSSGVKLVPVGDPSKAILDIDMEKLPKDDGNDRPDYALRLNFGDKVIGRKQSMAKASKLVVTGHSKEDNPREIEISLIAADGAAFGGKVTLGTKRGKYEIELDSLKPTRLITLPRPYPDFLPYYFEPGTISRQFDPAKVETLQVGIGPGKGPGVKLVISSIHLE